MNLQDIKHDDYNTLRRLCEEYSAEYIIRVVTHIRSQRMVEINLKKGDKVTHVKHKSYGVGEFLCIAKSAKKALVRWPEHSFSAYYDIASILKENGDKDETR